jgi:hypothetical protein
MCNCFSCVNDRLVNKYTPDSLKQNKKPDPRQDASDKTTESNEDWLQSQFEQLSASNVALREQYNTLCQKYDSLVNDRMNYEAERDVAEQFAINLAKRL